MERIGGDLMAQGFALLLKVVINSYYSFSMNELIVEFDTEQEKIRICTHATGRILEQEDY